MADNQPESSSINLVSLPKGVLKRDGSLAQFDSEKIRSAIQREIGRASCRERV